MKEIAGNLKRDVKDLLDESANIVAGFFKQGLCTVRGMADRWKNFTQEVSGAMGTLFKPFENALPPAPPPEQEPMVTVMESEDPELPVGTRMTLYEAETRVEQLNHERWLSDAEAFPVKVAIDYTMEGEQDRYLLPLTMGAGRGSMLEQMEGFVTSCLSMPEVITLDFYTATKEMGPLLHEHFGPQLQADLEKLSTKVLGFFHQHCTISRLEQQFEAQALAMPEKEQEKFRTAAKEAVIDLRRVANTGQHQPPAQHEQERPNQPEAGSTPTTAEPRQEGKKPQRSVKVKLQQIKGGQSKSTPAAPQKRRTPSER